LYAAVSYIRRIVTVFVLIGLSEVAEAQDPRVDNFFGPTQAIRQQAQIHFMTRYLADQDAIRALVDVTEQGLQNAGKTLGPSVARAGVYDAMSVLARVPPDSVTDPALRTKMVKLAQASRGNSKDTEALASLIESRFSLAPQPPPPSLPPLPNNPPVVPPATQQSGIDYRITVSDMTVLNGVSSRGETDYISLVVIGPDGQIGPFNRGPEKLKTGDDLNINLRSDTVRVANNQVPIRISWTAVNHEDTSQFKSVALALGNAAADLASGSGSPYTVIPGAIAKVGLNLLKGCDAQLFYGAVVIRTDQLKDGQDFEGWEHTAPQNRWHRMFDYPNVASPCNTGHYKLVVDVERGAAG
jgi:hypothetical protein